jgi:hypothetical protein
MKRLLAYLFIVLGLGLTFNVNAETKDKFTFIEGEGSAIGSVTFKEKFSGEYDEQSKRLIELIKTNRFNQGYICQKAKNNAFKNALENFKKGKSIEFRGRVLSSWYDDSTLAIENKLFRTKKIREGFVSEFHSKNVLCKLKVKFRMINFETFIVKKKPSQTQPDSDLEEEKRKIAEEKRKIEEEKRKKAAAKKKKEEEEQKRIAEAKKKEEEEQKYRILVKKYGDDCKDNSLGSPEFNKCLKDVEAEDLLQAKLQREFLASLTPEEARAYTCNNTFGFRKGSSNFKDCIFKLYTTELELEKLDLEKQLALAKVEAEKAKADTARAQVEIIQARSAAARAEGKLQEAQIQATKAQTLSMQQQAAASRQQAAAAQAQARAAQQQNSLNLMTQGLKMLSGNQSSSTRLRTNCSWSSIGISCR